MSLSSDRPIQSIPSHATSYRSILLFILHSTSVSSKLSLSLYAPLSHTCYLPSPSYFSWCDHANNIWSEVQVTMILVTLSSPLPLPRLSYAQISSSVPCSRTPSAYVSHVSDQFSHPSSSSSSVIYQTTGPKPLPKRFLHIVRSRASSFNWQYPLLSFRSSSSFLRLLPRLLVTSICPFIFPSKTCCRRQFLRKMWPIQLAFRFLISPRIFLCSLTSHPYTTLISYMCV